MHLGYSYMVVTCLELIQMTQKQQHGFWLSYQLWASQKGYLCSTYCIVWHCSIVHTSLDSIILLSLVSEIVLCYCYHVKPLGLFGLANGIGMAIAIYFWEQMWLLIACSGSTVDDTIDMIIQWVCLFLTLGKPFSTTDALSGCIALSGYIALFNTIGLLNVIKFFDCIVWLKWCCDCC